MMALPIIEQPLYSSVKVYTSPWTFPFTWTDQTAFLVGQVSYSEGGRVSPPGIAQTEVGTLTATFKNLSTLPVVGTMFKLEVDSDFVFTGYIQDISQRIVFDDSVSYSTPITLTTLYVLDWVGYISQFQAVGAGGVDYSTGAIQTDSAYDWTYRVGQLNYIIDSTMATDLVTIEGTPAITTNMGDTDFVGSYADHLNLIASTVDVIWYGAHQIPLNKTFGRSGLVYIKETNDATSSGITFTDALGSAGNLHYTEIDFENTTRNVANTIVANNRVRFYVPDVEVTRIGGFNEENYVVVNNSNVIGIAIDSTEQKSDATSITTYGNRQSEVDINVAMPVAATGNVNLIANPSMEYSDDGYSGGANSRVRRRQPSLDANPFTAFNGQWAMRSRQTTGTAGNAQIDYSGGESDGIPAVAGTTYYFKARAARGTVSRTDMRAQIRVFWYDDSETQIGAVISGAYVSLTTANTWYELTSGAIVAPAGTTRAKMQVFYNRTGGSTINNADILWADGFQLSKANISYFDGDTPGDTTNRYIWTGGVGASPSYKLSNIVDDIADEILARYSTTSMRASRIRWNAQEDLNVVWQLRVGVTIGVAYKGTTTTYRIVGIDGNITPDRYVIDYYIAKV